MAIIEQWRAVPGWDGFYEVSSHGRVRSLDRYVTHKASAYRPEQQHFKRGRILKATLDGFGYPGVHLYRPGEVEAVRVHALVASAFIGPRPEGYTVAHNDGNPANAWASNLRYATFTENFADKVKHGTRTGGERHNRAKLSQAQVDEMKRLFAAGKSRKELAPLFDIHYMHVCQILRGGRWNP